MWQRLHSIQDLGDLRSGCASVLVPGRASRASRVVFISKRLPPETQACSGDPREREVHLQKSCGRLLHTVCWSVLTTTRSAECVLALHPVFQPSYSVEHVHAHRSYLQPGLHLKSCQADHAQRRAGRLANRLKVDNSTVYG